MKTKMLLSLMLLGALTFGGCEATAQQQPVCTPDQKAALLSQAGGYGYIAVYGAPCKIVLP